MSIHKDIRSWHVCTKGWR